MRTESIISWYNENEGRAYPLYEYATRVADNGNIMPDDIITDIGIMVPPEHSEIYISSVRVTATLISIGIRSTLGGVLTGNGLLFGAFVRSDVRPYTAYPLVPAVDNVSGWVVFGAHRSTGIVEDYRFSTYDQSCLEKRIVKVIDALPVRKLIRLAGQNTVYADKVVTLEAGSNVMIQADIANNKIIVKLIPGMESRFLGPCKNKALESECMIPPIRRLNSVCADENGRITLRFE